MAAGTVLVVKPSSALRLPLRVDAVPDGLRLLRAGDGSRSEDQCDERSGRNDEMHARRTHDGE